MGVVVGDLNDGNVLASGDEAVPHRRRLDAVRRPTPAWWATSGSSTRGSTAWISPTAPRFSEGSDWYAFSVMLFSSLLCVHPFGGTHPSLATLLRRAEARHSVLTADVTLPRLALSCRACCPTSSSTAFEAVFEQDERAPFPAALSAVGFTRCRVRRRARARGVPGCHALGPLLTRPGAALAGPLHGPHRLRDAAGGSWRATLQGGLRYVYEEDGVVRREDGAVVLRTAAARGPRFGVQRPVDLGG